MHMLRSPQEAYRRVDFDAQVAGADPVQLVVLCYEQLGSSLGTAIHAQGACDHARKSAALARALSAITALAMGLDRDQPIAAPIATMLEAARQTVLGSVLNFDAAALRSLQTDVLDIASAFKSAAAG